MKKETQYKNLYVNTLCVSMFVACVGYASNGVIPLIVLPSVIAGIGNNAHSVLPTPISPL
jgi:hypothetical protein